MPIAWPHCPPLDPHTLEKPVAFIRSVTEVPKPLAQCDKPLPKNLVFKSSADKPAAKKSGHSEKTMQRALMFHFNWEVNDCYLNVEFGGGIADLLCITKARLCVEVEVKISMSDWNADQHKSKWGHPSRKKVSRMYYAVPEWMSTKIPAWLPKEFGVLAVGESGWVKEVRPAVRVCKYRASIKDYAKLMRGQYFRFTSKLMKELPKCQ